MDQSDTLYYYTTGNNGRDIQVLAAGHHSLPFEFHLPADCPTSYEGSIGRVRYYVSAKIRKMYEIEHTTMKLFTVIHHLDLNNDLRLLVRYLFFVLVGFFVGGVLTRFIVLVWMHCEIKRNVTHITHNKILVTLQQSAEANNDMTLCCLCCKSGPISATLYLETIGFVPGEGIPIHVEIENRSGRKISAASVTLLMVNKYVFLTQCLFQESFNTVKCTITNSFALFSFEFKMRGFCDVTMFFSSDIDTLFIDVWTFTKGSRASVLSVRTVFEYWPPPMEICIINLLHHFSINVDEEQNQNKQFFRFHINCARTMGLLYQPT